MTILIYFGTHLFILNICIFCYLFILNICYLVHSIGVHAPPVCYCDLRYVFRINFNIGINQTTIITGVLPFYGHILPFYCYICHFMTYFLIYGHFFCYLWPYFAMVIFCHFCPIFCFCHFMSIFSYL